MTWQWFAAGSLASTGLVLTWPIQSTVLLAAGLLAGRITRKQGPAVQSALYRATLVAVILCPVASMTMAAMGFDGLLIRLPGGISVGRDSSDPGRFRSPGDLQPPSDGTLGEQRSPEIGPTAFDRIPASEGSPSSGLSVKPTDAGIAAVLPSTTPPSRPLSWSDRITAGSSMILVAWLLVSVVLGTRLAISHKCMASVRSSAAEAEADVQGLCRELARRMHLVPPAVLRSPFLYSPCLDGLRSPAILLPEDAAEGLRETFIHELAHLARRDGLWNLLRQAATAVFWFQPLLWLLSKRLEETAEEVCDDYVVEWGADRVRYAGHLLELAERRLPPLAPTGVGMISLRSLLARRITRILDSTRVLSTRAGTRAIALTLVAGLAGTLLAGSLGVGEARRKAEVQTTTKADEPKARHRARRRSAGRSWVRTASRSPEPR